MTPLPIHGLEFHHIGVACENLERELVAFAGLGYQAEGEVFEDPIQGIRGCFLTQGGPRMELVAPLSGKDGVLRNLLANGSKMYHVAYVTPDIEKSLAEAVRRRAKVVVQPVPAVAFGNRRIAFFFLPNMLMIELIEK